MIPSTHDETRSAYELGLLPPLPGLALFGDYNTAPEPMQRITAEEYVHRLLHWRVCAIESRQLKILGYSTLRIHWLNTGNGVGLSREWLSNVRSLGGGWSLMFWLIGCPHNNMISTKISNCLHVQVCQDCGYTTTIDSSG